MSIVQIYFLSLLFVFFMIPDNSVANNTLVSDDIHQDFAHISQSHKPIDKLLLHNATPSSTPPPPSTRLRTELQCPHLLATNLPPPGPTHYAVRRFWWLTPTKKTRPPPRASSSRARLEQLLNRPNAVYSDDAWNGGVEEVWKGLVGNKKLKHSLPMNLVIKVLHAGWLRDGETWPMGAVVPDSDEDLPVPTCEPECLSYQAAMNQLQAYPLTEHCQGGGGVCPSGLGTNQR
ncbi:hypothetical protein HYDPIDRAFT_104790 [Hydnomerulius pinastri MD-312]|uniref:Uncharacterized protein n=1 Tax=Hydnomerulius pinastri MD-312 TaxID=994086 RepID=A0A0C9UZ65_9AGAM|nr:hypothetical protein HYDPIDRAFT_119692 [Hydnomerulius pinastri MD-312]KIJ70120.1 hypothetical protein HYDPIDRAFT_104790 [Hydnomerulius pinastri MD-312]